MKKPKRKAVTLARYRAQVGTAKSVELKLPQSLASSSLKPPAVSSSCAARSIARSSASGTRSW